MPSRRLTLAMSTDGETHKCSVEVPSTGVVLHIADGGVSREAALAAAEAWRANWELRKCICSSCDTIKPIEETRDGVCGACSCSDRPAVQQAACGIANSLCAPVHLIPTVVLAKLAERFDLGRRKRPDGQVWNATASPELEAACFGDTQMLFERLSHLIMHAQRLRDRLVRYSHGDKAAFEGDDDAAAVLWGGAFLVSAVDHLTCRAVSEQK